MSERKPWEETWAAHGSAVQADGRDVLDAWYHRDDPVGGHARARLAAAAPDLVRALLAVELAPGRVPGVDEECPWCGSIEGQSHAANCLRQAALRKAGVIE